MTDETKDRAVLEKLKRLFIVRHQANPDKAPDSDLFSVFPDAFSEELGMNIGTLEKSLARLEKKHQGKIVSEALCNLSVDPDVLNRDCIPIEELRMEKAYFKVRVSRSLISPVELTGSKPTVRIDHDVVYIRFGKKKEIEVSSTKSNQGALLAAFGNPWGVPRTKETVVEKIKELIGEEMSDKQMSDAMRELNRKIGDKEGPRLKLHKKTDNTLMLIEHETHGKHTVSTRKH